MPGVLKPLDATEPTPILCLLGCLKGKVDKKVYYLKYTMSCIIINVIGKSFDIY